MNENDIKNTKAADAIASAEFAWGSCQYDSAAALYMKLCKEEEEHSREEIIKELGIEVGKVQLLEGDVLVKFKELLFSDLDKWAEDGEDVTWLRTKLEAMKTTTEALHFLRDWSWDLWSGARYIAPWVFPELNLEAVPDAPGFGPKLSVMAQGLNNEVGTICWLLKSYGFVEDDEPFKEWDT